MVFLRAGVDAFSEAVCVIKDVNVDLTIASESDDFRCNLRAISRLTCSKGRECVSDHGKAACADLGGQCLTTRDGYYWISSICIILGAILLVTFIQPAARRLQSEFRLTFLAEEGELIRFVSCAGLPKSAWKVARKPERI